MSNSAPTWKRTAAKATVSFFVIAGVSAGAAACSSGEDEGERQVTDEEAIRLASVRQTHTETDPTAIQVSIPFGDQTHSISGFIDWNGPIFYGEVPSADDDAADQLVQIIPGMVASRDSDGEVDPAAIPSDDWSIRLLQETEDSDTDQLQSQFDIIISTIFSLQSQQADDARWLQENSTWQESTSIDGNEVDVFKAPLMQESEPESTDVLPDELSEDGEEAVEGEGGDADAAEALYSVDSDGTLHRFQVNPGTTDLATIDFLHQGDAEIDNIELIDLFGGPEIDPRAVTEEQAERLSTMRESNFQTATEVDIAVPQESGDMLAGTGIMDWHTFTGFFHLTDADGSDLYVARPGGLAKQGTDADQLPDEIPESGWNTKTWAELQEDEALGATELLMYRLLELASDEPDDVDMVQDEAQLLREGDNDDGETYSVVEFPLTGDAPAEPGSASFRYHVVGDRLDKVEHMTAMGVGSVQLAHVEADQLNVPLEVASEIG